MLTFIRKIYASVRIYNRYASPCEMTVLTSNKLKMDRITFKTEKPAAHLAHLVLPDTQANASQNQKS